MSTGKRPVLKPRRLLAAILFLPGVVAAYLAAAVAGAVLPGPVAARQGTPDILVGLAAGPIHYDLVLPLTPELRARFAFAEAADVPIGDPRAEWLIAGWGAREFYTTVGTYADISAFAAWRGVTGDSSVMRLQVIGPVVAPERLDWIALSPAEFEALVAGVETGFARDAGNRPIPLPVAGWGGAFYEGAGAFHIGRTCNVWLGEVLRGAGLPFGRWTPTTYAVRLSLWRFGLKVSPPGG